MLKVVVETEKIRYNFNWISNFLKQHHLEMILSIKALAGHIDLLPPLDENGARIPLADSRVLHFQTNNFPASKKIFMNIPPLLSFELYISIVQNTDICYVSHLDHLQWFEEVCRYLHKPFKLILIVNTGENREGYHIHKERNEIHAILKSLSELSYISLVGIATNIGCISEKVPTLQSAAEFETFCQEVQEEFSLSLTYIIGGSSNFLPLLEKGFIPTCINTLCIGGAILLGDIPGYHAPEGGIDLKQNIFHLRAFVCEIKKIDPHFLRLLLYIGKNDIHQSDIVWGEVEFLGISSDYMIVVIPEIDFQKYVFHGEFVFSLKYSAVPKILSSPYLNVCLS